MMKYIILSALLFSACTKQLDKLGPHNVTDADNLFSTEEGYQRAAEGMYALSIDAWTDDLIMTGEAGGNNLRKLQTAVTDNEDVFDYTHNRMDIWTPNYKIIQQANLIIDNVSNDETRATVLEAKAEALFCRAFAYFNLVRVYGRPYYQGAVTSPGAILVTSSSDNGKRARNTVQETYQQVISDLMASIPAYTSNRGSSYASIYASYGLLSRVYLYMTGTFTSADQHYADSVVKYSTLVMDGTYALVQGADFITYFNNQNTAAAATEDIFATNTGSTTASLLHSIFTPISGTSAGLYAPSPDLLALINAEPGDLRRKQFKVGTFTYSTFPDDSIATIKYNVSGTGATTRYSFSPIRHLRLIEIYLNRAEAYAKSGNNTAALQDLNVVRNRAGLTAADALTGQALFDAIFDQRRIELAFEGHNAFDYFRNGLTMKRSYESSVTAGITAVSTVNATDAKVVLRIPLTEIELNSALQQNEQ
jgi:hypothetical protein